MTLQADIFAQALTLEELEAKVKSSAAVLFTFLEEGSCTGIETQPSPR